jgi:enediyne polyketide synthase
MHAPVVASSREDVLLVAGAADVATMRSLLDELRASARALPSSDGLEELAAHLRRGLPRDPHVRCAMLASQPEHVVEGTEVAAGRLGAPGVTVDGRVFVGAGPQRIGLLFPGQGAPTRTTPGGLRDVVSRTDEVFADARLAARPEDVPEGSVQLALIVSSLAALIALADVGVDGAFALGHSLGELAALHWAGAFDASALLRLARARGEAMTAHAQARGTMATVIVEEAALVGLTRGLDVTVACVNAPRQHVVSGEVDAVEAVVARARERGERAIRLPVVGAFHSPLMRPAVPVFERSLARERMRPLRRPVISSVTGATLEPRTDLRDLLARQILNPVRFLDAALVAAREADLLIEVGPGRMLARLMAEITPKPVVSVRSGDPSPRGLLEAAAAAYAAGAPVAVGRLAPQRSPAVAT